MAEYHEMIGRRLAAGIREAVVDGRDELLESILDEMARLLPPGSDHPLQGALWIAHHAVKTHAIYGPTASDLDEALAYLGPAHDADGNRIDGTSS